MLWHQLTHLASPRSLASLAGCHDTSGATLLPAVGEAGCPAAEGDEAACDNRSTGILEACKRLEGMDHLGLPEAGSTANPLSYHLQISMLDVRSGQALVHQPRDPIKTKWTRHVLGGPVMALEKL